MKGIFEIQVDEKYIISHLVSGVQQNQYYSADLDAYATNIIKRGWKTWNGDGCIHAEVKELTVAEFMLIMSLDNGSVKYFNPYVKVPEADIDNEIPEGLPNRDRVVEEATYDEEGNVLTPALMGVHTWRTWRSLNHPLEEAVEGYYYFASATFGTHLIDTKLMIIHSSTDAELVDTRPIVEEDYLI